MDIWSIQWLPTGNIWSEPDKDNTKTFYTLDTNQRVNLMPEHDKNWLITGTVA